MTSSSIRDAINEFFTRNLDKIRAAALARIRSYFGIDVDDLVQAASMRLLCAFRNGLLDPTRQDVPIAQTVAWAVADLKRAQGRQVAAVSVDGHDHAGPIDERAEMEMHAAEVLDRLDGKDASIVRALLNGEEPELPAHLTGNTRSQRICRARREAVALGAELAA